MNFFKNDKNTILSLEAGQVPPAGFEQITKEEADEILNPVITLDQLKQNTLAQLDKQAQAAYVGGFVSEASGNKVTYDSTAEDQRTFTILYEVCQSAGKENGMDCPDLIPVRGRPQGKKQKQIYYLTRQQLYDLMADLAEHLREVKSKHWALQELANKTKSKKKLLALEWEE